MTLRQLEVFLAVARARSFSRAARTIHLSQPTLSEHTRQLEDELGSRLFSRRGREVGLTEAGRVFLGYASQIMATVSAGHQALADLDGLRHGSLVIGASTTAGTYVLPELLARFHRTYSGVDLALRVANSRIIEEHVRDGEVDVGVVGGHVLGRDERCVTAGVLDELVLIVPRGHPATDGRPLSAAALTRERLLAREEGSATRQVTERALIQAGIPLHPAMELDHTETIKRAVIAGLGVAFVSRYAVADEVRARRLFIARVRGLTIRRHFHIVHDERRPLSASARAFVTMLQKANH